MDIRQLQYLVALAREKHFTKAAEACNITQPTLSSRIRQLEQELGVPVVERGQRYLGLTQEGETVLKWAHAILDDCTAMTQELAKMKSGLAGRLVLGVIPTALLFTPRITGAMAKLYPNVDFKILSMTSIEIMERLKEHAIDVGISYLDNEPTDFHASQPLYREHHCVVMRTDHRLADRATLTWHEVANEALCLLNSEMQNRRIVDRTFRSIGAAPVCRVETTSIANILAHVQRGDGLVGIIPENFLTGLGKVEGIVAVPLGEPDVSHEIGLLAVDRDPMPPAIAALFEACKSIP